LNNHDGAEVKLTHLADDGSFLAVDLDPGASCGDTCDGPQGRGIREIAKELGCSRNTVRRYLREEQASGYGPRSPRATKPDPHSACLAERVEQARPRWIPATALLRAIPELGRDGVVSQLKAWPAPLKQGTRDPVVRFETPPGQQMRANLTWVRKCLQTTTACRWHKTGGPGRIGDPRSGSAAWRCGVLVTNFAVVVSKRKIPAQELCTCSDTSLHRKFIRLSARPACAPTVSISLKYRL
jgi:hypothetical protein